MKLRELAAARSGGFLGCFDSDNDQPAAVQRSSRTNAEEVSRVTVTCSAKLNQHLIASSRRCSATSPAPCCVEEAIKTTVPKAKDRVAVVEPMITLGKKLQSANRRLAFDRLRDREMVVASSTNSARALPTATAAVLRILKMGFRDGDKCADGSGAVVRPAEQAEGAVAAE